MPRATHLAGPGLVPLYESGELTAKLQAAGALPSEETGADWASCMLLNSYKLHLILQMVRLQHSVKK